MLNKIKKEKRDPNFNPEKCIVVNITTTSTLYKDFNIDTIKRDLNKIHGPTIIKKVNKYNFRSDSPKLMIELDSEVSATKLLSNWKKDTFGGSSARKTIDPCSLKMNSAMLKGVPLDTEEEALQLDINIHYPGAVCTRLLKQGKKLRMFRVKFVSTEQYQSALNSNGLPLSSDHIVSYFEKINDVQD